MQAGDKDVKALLAKVVEMEIWESAREGFIKPERSQERCHESEVNVSAAVSVTVRGCL